MLSIKEERAALASAMDFAGLTEDTIDELANIAEVRQYASGEPISTDDELSTGLCVVVDGLVAVTTRSEHRRAPVTIVLGAGGVFGEDALARTGMQGAVAYRRSTVLFMKAEAVKSLATERDDLRRVASRLTEIQREAPWIVEQLRRSALFENVPPGDLYPLLEGALIVDLEPDEVIIDADERMDGLMMVMRGEIRIVQPEGVVVGGQVLPGRPLNLAEGTVLGDHSLIRPGPLLRRVEAGNNGCRIIRFRSDVFREQFGSTPAFRRGIFASPVLEEGDRRSMMLAHARADIALGRSNWVGIVSDDRGLPLETLTRWVATAAAEEWGDRILVVHLDEHAGYDPDSRRSSFGGEAGVVDVHIDPTGGDFTPEMIRLALSADSVFIDFGSLDPLDYPEWIARVRRTAFVATQPYTPVGDRLLDQVSRPLVYTAVVPAPPPEPGQTRIIPRGAVRISRELIDAAHRGVQRQDLPVELRTQLSRWMRGITQRSVGIALGGGGALAYAHVAMIQELDAMGIPIDMVAGVSGGAVVGAFYAAGQHLQPDPDLPMPEGLEHLPGLARLIQLGAEFERVCRAAPVSSGVVANWVDKQLGGVRLEDLLVPFFPVAADIDRAVQVSIRVGPIGFGVRCSGAFPGPFTPVTIDRRELAGRRPLPWERARPMPTLEPGTRTHYRLVDGGVINNIPDDTLYLEGAQAVLASNVVPAPQSREETSDRHVRTVQTTLQRGVGRVARAVREFDPVVRMDDALRSGYMMMHSPADWTARTADAKYQARTVGYTFPDWAHGDEIRRQALEGPGRADLVRAARQLRRRMDAMRWQRDEDMGVDALVEAIEAYQRRLKRREG